MSRDSAGTGQDGASLAKPGRGAALHILIVDDERNMRRTLADIFRDEGFEVSTADCGERAVALCARNDYDTVLMDVRMPGIDGVEAFREMRRSGRNVPVIMMSAYSVEHLEREALAHGVMAFVHKPLDAGKVIDLIRKAVERTRPEHRKGNSVSVEEKP